MEASLIALMKVLEELDPESVPADGDTKEILAAKFRRAQMVMYLAQAVGKVDLGYRFGWHTFMPWDQFLALQDAELTKEAEKVAVALKGVLSTMRARLKHRPRRGLEQAIVNLDEALWRIDAAISWTRDFGEIPEEGS